MPDTLISTNKSPMTPMTTEPTPAAPASATPAAPASATPPGTVPSYGTLWKRTPGSAVYLLAIFVVAMVSVSVLAALLWTGVGLLVLVIGLPIVVGTLLVARGFGVADRYLLRLTGREPVQEPAWNRDREDAPGFWMTLTLPLRNGHYWLYLVHGMIVSPIVSTITFAITVAWLSVSLGGLTYWFWGMFIPNGDNGAALWGDNVAEALPWVFGGLPPEGVEIVLYLIAGIVCAVTLPWVLNGLAWVHHSLAKGMLGPWRSDALVQEVRAEAAARGAAVHAEGVSLRRLERDIHDGPQQRLVRLQLDLAALERRAEAGDTDSAARLAQEARGQAKAALDELRALSSGVAPPLLQDRGLAAALSALAAENALPVTAEVDPGVDSAVGPEVARNVYFIVAELLTNAVKHSGASGIALRAAIRPGSPSTPAMLDVWVVDNGTGGAHMSAGHGLEGLRDRVHGLRGVLVVESPLGGPTTVGAHIPLVPAGAA
ncbi:MAG TPA: sensor domain-containing protein [Microbacterium sp.]|uniref:sensor histidine kinase n=1 Tax=Microbacterium sp. TaxID=51671 RepID=UPI002B6EDFDB|nr:sensor domain-containing protein [Microbacterium sp.]HWI30875.1 sensor domain-containing protein [Microbacterium sp.]